jgi:hypothetical protein
VAHDRCLPGGGFASRLAVNLPPSATFLNQAAAVSGWVCSQPFCMGHAWPSAPSMRWGVGLRALLAAVALLMAACAGSWMMTGLPSSLTLSALGLLAAAALVACVGAAAMSSGQGAVAFRAFCIALVMAGILSAAIGAVQVFAPQGAMDTGSPSRRWRAGLPATCGSPTT